MSTLTSPAYRVPIGIDAEGRPVMADRAFFDYIAGQLFARVGGAIAPTNSELVVDMHDDAGIEEMKHDLYRSRDAINQAPSGAFFIIGAEEFTRLHAAEAALEDLRKRVSSLEQGVQL